MTAAEVLEPERRGVMAGVPEGRDDRLRRILSRAGRWRLTPSERWLFGIGAALVVAGFMAMIVGWVGTSRTVLVAGQIPYMVSGGLIGLGLVFIGGFCYFAHWVAILVHESRERARANLDETRELRQSISELSTLIASVVDGRATNGFIANGRVGLDLVATPTGSMMHLADCPAVTGRRGLRQVGMADGLKPCGICRPLEEVGA